MDETTVGIVTAAVPAILGGGILTLLLTGLGRWLDYRRLENRVARLQALSKGAPADTAAGVALRRAHRVSVLTLAGRVLIPADSYSVGMRVGGVLVFLFGGVFAVVTALLFATIPYVSDALGPVAWTTPIATLVISVGFGFFGTMVFTDRFSVYVRRKQFVKKALDEPVLTNDALWQLTIMPEGTTRPPDQRTRRDLRREAAGMRESSLEIDSAPVADPVKRGLFRRNR